MKLIPPEQSILGTFSLGYMYWSSVLNSLWEDMMDIRYHELMKKVWTLLFNSYNYFYVELGNERQADPEYFGV